MKTSTAARASMLFGFVAGCDPSVPTRDPPTEEDFIVRVRGVPFVQFTGGTFTMGREGSDYASPPTEVKVRPFQIMKTEVTVGMYFECVREGACTTSSPPFNVCSYDSIETDGLEAVADLPMNCVDWTQAKQFAAWFGQGARLPTEAEWEFAATNGTRRPYPWGTAFPSCEVVVRGPDSLEEENGPHCRDWIEPVCSRPAGNTPGPRVLCDMLGNVGELVEDEFHPAYDCDYPLLPTDERPFCPPGTRIPADGSAWNHPPIAEAWRVARGPSFRNMDPRTTVTDRSAGSTRFGGETSGFRLARDDGW